MNESELSKFAFNSLRGAIKQDRNPTPDYELSRDAAEYECLIFGLNQFFKYASSLSPKPKILDLGTGKGEAIRGFRNNGNYSGIDFYGLGLTNFPEHQTNFAPGHFIKSSAEKMKIESNSVQGAISVFGAMTHSLAPELIVSELNRILVKKGVVKFTNRNNDEQDEQLNSVIIQELTSHGFGAVLLNPDKHLRLKAGGDFKWVVGVGIKDGTQQEAINLLKSDLAEALEEFKKVYEPKFNNP
ncbi:MAG: methyltransferase domain-containing protein [Candidatus Doudnabacteria bacterium]|nr:methyltransferase domain-containing protein [Candidatus Doudnabacteria bacterium]